MGNEEKIQCVEYAKIQLPWAGKIYKYCPVHANNLAKLSKVMGEVPHAETLPLGTEKIQCQSFDPLTDEEKAMNIIFSASIGEKLK